jgi:hypothetical protein
MILLQENFHSGRMQKKSLKGHKNVRGCMRGKLMIGKLTQ